MAAVHLSSLPWSSILLVLLLSVAKTYGGYKYNTKNCDAVRSAYGSKGYSRHDVPANKIQGESKVASSPVDIRYQFLVLYQ